MTKPTPTPIAIQVAAPSPALPGGATAEGFFVVENGKVTLTGRDGYPALDPEGRDYKRELRKGDTPVEIAAQLLRSFRTKVRGSRVSGFDGPIRYPKGWGVPC